jgi:CRISPR/Cas system CSM-associated protein Csm2 small subunit
MAETLGMLCDKLTIVKLKQYHTEDSDRLISLGKQAVQLQAEIDEYVNEAVQGNIPVERMTFDANKVFKKEGNVVEEVTGNFGEVMYQLADANCRLWHEQEKVYEFETVPAEEKDKVVKKLALLNLERNKCIDRINNLFTATILKK